MPAAKIRTLHDDSLTSAPPIISGAPLFLRPCRGERKRVVAFVNELDYLVFAGSKLMPIGILAVLRGDDLFAQ